MNRPTTLERAFQLADEGFSTSDIRMILQREGYDPGHIIGSVIQQLSKRVKAATTKKL
jgi:hypothetical protein